MGKAISGFGTYGAPGATASVYVLDAMVVVVLIRKLFGIYICYNRQNCSPLSTHVVQTISTDVP